jgi:predicted MFS family arabinose efflux permease
MGYAITLIAQDFHFSEKHIGIILGAFGAGYIFSTFLGGISADRLGAKKTLTFSTIISR